MVHLAPSSPGRRRFDLIIGGLLAVLGVAVAVLAVVALGRPQSHQAKAALTPTSSAVSVSPEPTTSGSSSTTASASSSTSKSTSSGATSTGAATSSAAFNVKNVPLVVLNSTNRTGLAATAAQRFQAGGWTVTKQDNLSNDILSTCAYYDPSNPNNQVAAQALMTQFPAIKRIKEKFDGLPAGPIVVVLTNDYS
jgi:cytoskeletal protein RodZ